MKTTIPGIKVAHCEITERCRVVQGGDLQAFDEAVRRIRKCFESNVPAWPQGKSARYHVVLTVDYPMPDPARYGPVPPTTWKE